MDWYAVCLKSPPGHRNKTHTRTHTHEGGEGGREGEVICIVTNSCSHFSQLLPLLKQQKRAVVLRRVGTQSGQRRLNTREEGQKNKKIKYRPQWGRAEPQGEKRTVSDVCFAVLRTICRRNTRQCSSQRSAAVI